MPTSSYSVLLICSRCLAECLHFGSQLLLHQIESLKGISMRITEAINLLSQNDKNINFNNRVINKRIQKKKQINGTHETRRLEKKIVQFARQTKQCVCGDVANGSCARVCSLLVSNFDDIRGFCDATLLIISTSVYGDFDFRAQFQKRICHIARYIPPRIHRHHIWLPVSNAIWIWLLVSSELLRTDIRRDSPMELCYFTQVHRTFRRSDSTRPQRHKLPVATNDIFAGAPWQKCMRNLTQMKEKTKQNNNNKIISNDVLNTWIIIPNVEFL